MNRDDIKERLNKVFCEVFDDRNIVINESMTANDIETWDSMMHINLIVSAEEEFGISVPPHLIGKLKNVGELLDIICHNRTR